MYKENITAIELLITNYFEGIFYGDTQKLQSCFHSNAPIYGDINGADYFKNSEDYIEGVANRQSPNDLKETFNMKIVGVDIMGKIAMAKLHVPMLGYNYYDYLSLTKIENEWKIVAKVFTHVE
ncbi:nuclear transport factor 2 family protein [Tenacibaculum singaporense]|uniref:nuclear transport factor 2 family protein n=1 Tax=Tenacibaculum singaporense TaxID=2358479 RepID=UPI000F6631B7|nr:nuclear transport factor 2 family protein [Tenacibaculum singaporense]RSC93713.1 nuclear transport factor 2 family protein [Tenacibaculum singaporense]